MSRVEDYVVVLSTECVDSSNKKMMADIFNDLAEKAGISARVSFGDVRSTGCYKDHVPDMMVPLSKQDEDALDALEDPRLELVISLYHLICKVHF
jgi:hypothetical protein